MCDALDTDPFDLTREVVAESGEDNGHVADTPRDGEEEKIMEDNGDDDGEAADLLEKKKNRELITRFQDMLRVISCTRTATPDGYSSIQCVVQLDNDGKMQGVKDYIRLHFTFLREPQHDHDTGASDDDDDDVKVIYANADDYFSGEDEEGGSGNDGCDDDATMDNVKNGKKECVHGQPTKKRKRIAKDIDAPPPVNDEHENVNVEINGSGSDIPNNQQSTTFKPKTIITYKIDYSIDSGKMEQLLGVDVLAFGEHPSIEEAIPMMEEEDDDDDDAEEDNVMNGGVEDDKIEESACANHDHRLEKEETSAKQSPKSGTEFEEIEMSDHDSSSENNNDPENNNNNTGEGDRYGVFVNPQNVVAFLDRANINLNEQSVFYFLMTLPFYEHEWDIAGFLLSALIEEEMEEDEDSVNNGECRKECPGD